MYKLEKILRVCGGSIEITASHEGNHLSFHCNTNLSFAAVIYHGKAKSLSTDLAFSWKQNFQSSSEVIKQIFFSRENLNCMQKRFSCERKFLENWWNTRICAEGSIYKETETFAQREIIGDMELDLTAMRETTIKAMSILRIHVDFSGQIDLEHQKEMEHSCHHVMEFAENFHVHSYAGKAKAAQQFFEMANSAAINKIIGV